MTALKLFYFFFPERTSVWFAQGWPRGTDICSSKGKRNLWQSFNNIFTKLYLKLLSIYFACIFLQEEWRRQKAQLTATLERAWAKSIAWTTPTTASLDNRQGHLNTQLKLSSGWINYYTKILTARNETFITGV